MSSLSDSSVSSLSENFSSSVAADARHALVNSAKLNSIQSAASYEQFSARVQAAHLKPLNSHTDGGLDEIFKEKLRISSSSSSSTSGEFSSGAAKIPEFSNSGRTGRIEEKSSILINPTEKPQNWNEFHRQWRVIPPLEISRFSLLFSCGAQGMRKIFSGSAGLEIIEEFIMEIEYFITQYQTYQREQQENNKESMDSLSSKERVIDETGEGGGKSGEFPVDSSSIYSFSGVLFCFDFLYFVVSLSNFRLAWSFWGAPGKEEKIQKILEFLKENLEKQENKGKIEENQRFSRQNIEKLEKTFK